jgi:hypothetical protein
MDMKNTTEAVGFVLSLGEGVYGLADGKGTLLSDALAFVAVAQRAPAALKDVKLVLPEMQDMDEAEKAELKAFVARDFDLADDQLELLVEQALAAAIEFSELLKLLPQALQAKVVTK